MSSKSFDEAWLDGPDGHHFYTRTYPATSPQKAVLVFVHGFGDHISRYEAIHPRFAERGITVFAYDLRGFGRTALDVKHRSPGETYGKTSRTVELGDLEWWVNHVARTCPDVPIFVMGHSAGGGMVLAFGALSGPPPSSGAITKVSGIIAQCPLVRLTYPQGKVIIAVAGVLSKVFPSLQIPAPMPEDRFSHDPAIKEALLADPFRMPKGTVKGLHSMISQGEELLEIGYKRWSRIPLLMTWGTADEVNCPRAGVAFFNKLQIEDKKLVEYDGALHDLLHEAGDVPDKVIGEYISFILAHLGAQHPAA